MKQFWQLTLSEIRLTLKRGSFWFVGILAVALILVSSINLLLLFLLVAGVVKRDERSGFSKILASLPHNPVKLYLARALAVLCLLWGMWPLMTGVILLVTGTVEWLLPEAQYAWLTLKYLSTCLTAVGWIFLCGMLVRSPGQLYLVVVASWFLNVFFASNISYFPPWLQLFIVGHGILLPSAPSAAVGFFTQQGLLPGLAAFQGALAVLFILGAVVRHMKQRGESLWGTRWFVIPFLSAVMLGLAGGSVFLWEITQRYDGNYQAVREVLRVKDQAGQGKPADEFDLSAYRLAVDLQTATHTLEGTAWIKLKRSGNVIAEVIPFTLRPCFRVRDVRLMGQNQPLLWRRNGSCLAVELPTANRNGKECAIEIRYWGKVWEWSTGRAARPGGPVNLIAPEFSLLRSGYAWYPVPGDAPLFRTKSYVAPWSDRTRRIRWPKRVGHAPAPFTLTVRIDSDSTVVSNLEPVGTKPLTGKYRKEYRFSAQKGRDLFLIAGPYVHQKRFFPNRQGWADCYCFEPHCFRSEAVWQALAEPYQFYESLFQPGWGDLTNRSGKMCTVIEMPQSVFANAEGWPVRDLYLTDAILLNESHFQSGKGRLAPVAEILVLKLNYAVLRRWWQEDFIRSGLEREDEISEGLLLYYYTLNLTQRLGRDMEVTKENTLQEKSPYYNEWLLPDARTGPVIREVFLLMDALWGGGLCQAELQEVSKRLYQVYASAGEITATEFAQAVEPVLLQADLPPRVKLAIGQRLQNLAQAVREQKPERIRLNISMPLIVFNVEEWDVP